MVIVPASTELLDYEQTTTLDGRDYRVQVTYNQRADRWYLSLSDQDGAPIAMGLKIVAEVSLLRRISDARRPPGYLMCRDLQANEPDFVGGEKSSARDPGRVDLGLRHQIVYFTLAEVTPVTLSATGTIETVFGPPPPLGEL